MAKPEWGEKRLCQECGAKFYDMRRRPVTCPRCGAVIEIEVAKGRRRAPVGPPEPDKVVAPISEEEEAVPRASEDVVAEEGEDLATIEEKSDEGDDLIEDPDELGEDESDVAGVIDGQYENDDER